MKHVNKKRGEQAMVRKIYLINFSPCGGTEKIVHAIGKDLPLPKETYNITLPRSRSSQLRFSGDDLVILGFPVYGGRMPRFFSTFIGHLSGSDTPLVMAVVYGNRAYEGAFLDMHEGIKAKGFRPIAAIAAVAEHSANPSIAAERPDANDRAKLAEFGRLILEKVQTGAPELDAPGTYPEWKLPTGISFLAEADPDVCTQCGICVDVCPRAC